VTAHFRLRGDNGKTHTRLRLGAGSAEDVMDHQETARTDAQLLRDVLETAQAKHGCSALQRMEEGVRVVEGVRPPFVSPEPLQRPGIYLPGFTAKPWHDTEGHAGAQILEDSWQIIREELLGALEQRQGFQRFLEAGEIASAELSAAMFVRQAPFSCTENRALCPRTVAIIESIPRLGEIAMFSALNPGGRLVPHCGPWNFRLTMHLGLIVPEGGWIRVAEETRTWQEGRCLLFDDSFEHEVQMHASSTRIILLLHLWHPDLTDPEIDFLVGMRAALTDGDRDRTARMVEDARHSLRGQKWWV
jgi:Aspartyl/Asparaginyl beta-hydroxylase